MVTADPERLLHIAALSTALCIAYVGLDKIHQVDRRIETEIKSVKKHWASLIKDLDITNRLTDDDGCLKGIYDTREMQMLCFIADKDIIIKGKWRPVRLWVYRQWCFPLLEYFRTRLDLTIVNLVTIFATLLFILLSSGAVYEVTVREAPLLEDLTFCRVCFWIYVGLIAFIFSTVLCSTRVINIRTTCDKLNGKIRSRFKDTTARDIDEFVNTLTRKGDSKDVNEE